MTHVFPNRAGRRMGARPSPPVPSLRPASHVDLDPASRCGIDYPLVPRKPESIQALRDFVPQRNHQPGRFQPGGPVDDRVPFGSGGGSREHNPSLGVERMPSSCPLDARSKTSSAGCVIVELNNRLTREHHDPIPLPRNRVVVLVKGSHLEDASGRSGDRDCWDRSRTYGGGVNEPHLRPSLPAKFILRTSGPIVK
jgi:hypothetical protein